MTCSKASSSDNSPAEPGTALSQPSQAASVAAASQASAMLSVDFSAPLAGPARAERIRQMSHNHTAFEKSRLVQETLVKIQQSLRRMPGVSSAESNELVAQLQEVGQIISQETSQLVDAVMNLTLDQEDTDKAIARMGLEASLAKATIEDQAQAMRDLRADTAAEAQRRDQTERQSGGISSESRDEVIKDLEDTIHHLEDQVNNRRSLWVMKNSDPQSIARAIETLADSMQNRAAHNTIASMKTLATHGEDRHPAETATMAMAPPPRPPSVFQRSLTVAPPKFGPLQAGPPRAPSAFSHDHRRQSQRQGTASSWGSTQGRLAQGQQQQANQSQNPFFGATSSSSSSSAQLSRPPTRKSFHHPSSPSSRYRPTAAEFQPASHSFLEQYVPNRPGTAFGHRMPMMGIPQTPTSANRHNRRLDHTPEFGHAANTPSSNSTAIISAGNSSGNNNYNSHALSGPLIHMTDRSVAAWNECIMEFYALIRAFVERHASIPDAAMAMKITNTHLWPVLLATYHPLSAREATSYLDLHLREDNPKCCLVTRVIIDYVVNRVWVPNAWTGSTDGQCTFALIDLEKDLEKTQGQPSAHRQPLLDKQAFVIETILKSEPPSFHTAKVQDMTTSLLAAIQPLLNRLHNPSGAYRDLAQVAEYAWELSSKILTSRLTFDFRFPEVGTRFSSQSMLPVWPALDPTELQAKHWRVALVTTPVITCRNDTGSNISAHSVALADVYCMQ